MFVAPGVCGGRGGVGGDGRVDGGLCAGRVDVVSDGMRGGATARRARTRPGLESRVMMSTERFGLWSTTLPHGGEDVPSESTASSTSLSAANRDAARRPNLIELLRSGRSGEQEGGATTSTLAEGEEPLVYTLDSEGVLLSERVAESQNGAILVFLRHYGCTLCRQLLTRVQKELADSAKQLGVDIIAIGPGSVEHALKTKRELDFTAGDVLSDPLRNTYASLSFKSGMFNTFNLSGLRAVIGSFLAGHKQDWTLIPADPFALGGVLVVDPDANIWLKHTETYAGDHPTTSDLADACRALYVHAYGTSTPPPPPPPPSFTSSPSSSTSSRSI